MSNDLKAIPVPPAPVGQKQRALHVVLGEILEAAKDLCFAANAPIAEHSLTRMGSAAIGLERAVRRLRLSVLSQPEYPTHDEVLLLQSEWRNAKAEVWKRVEQIYTENQSPEALHEALTRELYPNGTDSEEEEST